MSLFEDKVFNDLLECQNVRSELKESAEGDLA